MKLLYQTHSPYARKALVFAHEERLPCRARRATRNSQPETSASYAAAVSRTEIRPWPFVGSTTIETLLPRAARITIRRDSE
jgi:hypothetical protein